MIWRTVLSSLLGGGTIPVLVLAVTAGAFATGYVKGRVAGAQKAQVAELRREKDELIADRNRLQVQLRNASRVIAEANDRSQEDARSLGALEKKVDDYANRPVDENGCFVLDDADADFLRQIR